MKTPLSKIVTVSLALAAGATLTQAEDPSLKVGDNAPKLQTGKWVQGDPVKAFKSDKAYLVEFWATWCGPCRVTIPHLNEIWQKYKDKGLVVIGQDVWERDEAQVAPFVKKMGEKMTYRVALDDKKGSDDGRMAETWMVAAGQEGIPTAFVVDKKGRLAWIGHPMELKASVIEEVLAGTNDIKKAAEQYQKEKKQQEQMMKLAEQFDVNMEDKAWDKAEATLGEMEKLTPAEERAELDLLRFQLLVAKGDMAAASGAAGKLSEANKGDAMLQNELAWDLVTHGDPKGQALDTAATIAGRANDAAKGQDPAVLDTLARVTFLQGKKDKAIELQQKAISLAEDDTKDELQRTLDSYKNGKLPAVEE